MSNRNIGILTVAIVVVIGFAVCGLIINRQQGIIDSKNKMIEATIEKSKIDLELAWEVAENEKQKARIEIENMPADIVAITFLTDDEIISRFGFVDKLTAEVITAQLQFFREMEIYLATVSDGIIQ